MYYLNMLLMLQDRYGIIKLNEVAQKLEFVNRYNRRN